MAGFARAHPCTAPSRRLYAPEAQCEIRLQKMGIICTSNRGRHVCAAILGQPRNGTLLSVTGIRGAHGGMRRLCTTAFLTEVNGQRRLFQGRSDDGINELICTPHLSITTDSRQVSSSDTLCLSLPAWGARLICGE